MTSLTSAQSPGDHRVVSLGHLRPGAMQYVANSSSCSTAAPALTHPGPKVAPGAVAGVANLLSPRSWESHRNTSEELIPCEFFLAEKLVFLSR